MSVCARASACMENALMTDRRVCVGERERERERDAYTHTSTRAQALAHTARETDLGDSVMGHLLTLVINDSICPDL